MINVVRAEDGTYELWIDDKLVAKGFATEDDAWQAADALDD